MIEPPVKRIDSLSLTHWRVEHETYFDTDLWQTDIVELGWEAHYTWFRLLSGPEYVRDGFPVARLSDAFDPREFDPYPAIDALLHAGLIVDEGDYYTFPNVEWGYPPEEDE